MHATVEVFADGLFRDSKLPRRQAASMRPDRPRLADVVGQKMGLNRHGHMPQEQAIGLTRIVECGEQARSQMSDNGIGEIPTRRDAKIDAGRALLIGDLEQRSSRNVQEEKV